MSRTQLIKPRTNCIRTHFVLEDNAGVVPSANPQFITAGAAKSASE